MERYYLDMIDEVQKGSSEAKEEIKEAIVDFFKSATRLTEIENWLKDQINFLLGLPAFTKDIELEHKIMISCYQDILDKIEGEENNECL